MIDIKEKKDCCGCNACYDACSKHAIDLESDIEGFWYPKVDKDKCVDCGLCDKVCPQLNISGLKKNEFVEPICFAAINRDIEVRFASTTGGIFSALADQIYAHGGYVGGAIYREDWSVAHFISNNPEDLARLRQSKYSQSDTRGFYDEVKRLLIAGEKVLVCGTPCQMAALRSFLRKDYDNLIILDFICKSITSPKFFAKYLDFWERKAKSKLVSFKFKDKELGWRSLVKRFDFKNGNTLYSRARDKDLYSTAYHSNVVSRPSCYECQFKGMPRISDITIADFWGCENYKDYRHLDDNAGTSAVMCNNSKGLTFFKESARIIDYVPANFKDILAGNPAILKQQQKPNVDREVFFKDLDTELIENVVPKHLDYLESNRAKSFNQRFKRVAGIWYRVFINKVSPFRFAYYNLFCKKVKTDWWNEGVIYPYSHSVIELQKNATLELHGPMHLGMKRVVGSKLETRLLVESGAHMVVNEAARIFYGSDIEVFKNAELLIDELGTNINFVLVCGKKITMKGHVSVGRDVSIRDTNAHIIALDGYKVLRPVTIENHVWLCSGATICPGVKIKAGAIVGANSYVVQNVPAHSLVSGSPAKVVQTDIAWKL